MKKFSFYSVIAFYLCLVFAIYFAVLSALSLSDIIEFGRFYSIVIILLSILFIYIYSLIIYWAIVLISPLKSGDIREASLTEFMFGIEFFFVDNVFLTPLKSCPIPPPIKTQLYKLLGLKIGRNSFVNKVSDPRFVQIGDNTILGEDSTVFCHIFENNRKVAIAPVKIGSNVVVGANVVIMPGVNIGDNSVIAAGAVVTKFTQIPSGEIWGGVPARKIRDKYTAK